MAKGKVNNNFFIIVTVVFILLCLSLINIQNVTSNELILGAHSEIEKDETNFWEEFLGGNPNYVPGLIETGNIDQAKQIDPNFEGLD